MSIMPLTESLRHEHTSRVEAKDIKLGAKNGTELVTSWTTNHIHPATTWTAGVEQDGTTIEPRFWWHHGRFPDECKVVMASVWIRVI